MSLRIIILLDVLCSFDLKEILSRQEESLPLEYTVLEGILVFKRIFQRVASIKNISVVDS